MSQDQLHLFHSPAFRFWAKKSVQVPFQRLWQTIHPHPKTSQKTLIEKYMNVVYLSIAISLAVGGQCKVLQETSQE